MTRSLSALALTLFVASSSARAEELFEPKVARVEFKTDRQTVKRGEAVTFRLTVKPNPASGAYTYQVAGGKSKIVLPPPGDLVFVTAVKDPDGADWEPKDADLISHGPVTWEFVAIVSPTAKGGKTVVELQKNKVERTSLQVCTASGQCFTSNLNGVPITELTIEDATAVPIPDQYRKAYDEAVSRAKPLPPAPPGPPTPEPGGGATPAGGPSSEKGTAKATQKVAKPIEQYEDELKALARHIEQVPVKPESPIWAFLATAALWGLISLVTPCVFPMIPITVSIFLKQAHGSFAERLKLAGVYSLTIITVLGVSAFALLKFMAWLSAHPMTNLFLGGLFLVLALSLFGMYELTLPNFMARRLQAKQAKGGVVGTIFGALAFTVISFTCVAPFLGGFAGISAADSGSGSLISMPTTREVFGGLAFATAFAAPFFVLALVPGLLRALPRSGGWLDSVKVVMGFLELAAALKFLRTAELGVSSPTQYFTFDVVLAGWMAISFACGLYLLNVFRLPHDEERPNIGVARLLFALLFLGFGVYLLPAVFKTGDGKAQRPTGAVYAWVDAFLLPEPGAKSESELAWGTDLKDALDRAKAEGIRTGKPRPVFIDFTGAVCTNCSYNETYVFPLPAVKAQLEQFERVKLYCQENPGVPVELYTSDPGPAHRILEARANDEFKYKVFRDGQLPLYVVLIPRVSDQKVVVLGVYPEGKINNPDEFAAFLKKALEDAKK